jgi:hypothetical protein
MEILRNTLLSCFCLILSIQAADPPADVDAALRARVQDFYQMMVAKKYRQAEQLVAEDTKDLYYDSKKPDIKEFRITAIKYGPDFKSAQVSLFSRTQIMFIGAGVQVMDLPITSSWKIENGQWCWFIDASKRLDTPFGRLKPAPDGAKADANALFGRVAATGAPTTVQVTPARVQLDQAHPQPQIVTLKNTLPAEITIEAVTSSPALKIEIGKAKLAADESTQVTITPVAGSAERPAQLILKIGPLGQSIQIALDYPAPR